MEAKRCITSMKCGTGTAERCMSNGIRMYYDSEANSGFWCAEMKSVMIKVRVTSVSLGSGYPRIVYNSRHERMGDAMVGRDARGEPTRFERDKRKEREKSSTDRNFT